MSQPGSESGSRIGVLFVCLGNICRSPLAEGVFLHLARERGDLERFRVDSAGTGDWHAGSTADPRSIAIAAMHGIDLTSRARQVTPTDFERFDHIIAMDHSNRKNLIAMGCPKGKIRLLLEWDPESNTDAEVPDPYHGGEDGFELVYSMCERACEKLLADLDGSHQPG